MAENFKLSGKCPIPAPKSESSAPKKAPAAPAKEVVETPPPPEFELPVEYADLEDDMPMPQMDMPQMPMIQLPMSNEDKIYRRQLIVRIRKYKAAFPDIVGDIDTGEIRDLGLSELEVLAEDVEYMVSVRQSTTASRELFLAGTSIAEVIAKPFNLKLKGLNNVCQHHDKLLLTVDEIGIRYGDTMSIGPEVRLGILLGQIALAVHQHNSSKSDEDDKPAVEAAHPVDTAARDKLMEEL